MADQGKHQLEKVVGQTIAKRRQSLGISQFELAERLNIAPASLSRIENGLAAPRFSRLERIQPLRSHWVGNRESPYADDAP